MLKVALIGCGKIADDHLHQIRRVPDCEVVGACDLELLMARQLCERFQIKQPFDNVAQLLESTHPDVVHITTPPQSHFALGTQCLKAGCHVYIEKPFAVTSTETENLIALAESSGRIVTVGHDLQFSHGARQMRQAFRDGYLGGPPVHMESYYCYDLSDPGYAKALLSDKNHWIRRLPGKLLHNVISHGIARIAEYFPSDSWQVSARGFVSPLLRSIGENDIIDELRVTISDQSSSTAYFTFSSQMRPSLNGFLLYGPKNGLALDQDRETLIKLPGDRFKSFAEKFIPPVELAAQQLRNVATNASRFLRSDFHMKTGMKYLIESFYHAISHRGVPPIPYREIVRTSQIMDRIWDQLTPTSSQPSQERCA